MSDRFTCTVGGVTYPDWGPMQVSQFTGLAMFDIANLMTMSVTFVGGGSYTITRNPVSAESEPS
jgi:hypothetical protein